MRTCKRFINTLLASSFPDSTFCNPARPKMLAHLPSGRTAARWRPASVLQDRDAHGKLAMFPFAFIRWGQNPVERRAIFMLHPRLRRPRSRRRSRLRVRFVMIFVLAGSSGCGSSDGLNRLPVSGTVTCDGKPVPSGAILFEPATPESGTAVGAIIREGAFAISRSQ